jgi:serine/threonine-protein kinase
MADNPEERAIAHEVLTDAGQRPGTPLYMSPEQVRGGAEIDARTDVYSVGAVLYEMLTLVEPFRGKKVGDTFEMIVSAMPVPPREKAPDRRIPQLLADICLRALAKQPSDRFQTLQERFASIDAFRRRSLESL